MSANPQDIAELKAECAALRASFALLVSGLHGSHGLGGPADWRDGAMATAAARIAGVESDNPHFAAAMQKIAEQVSTASASL